MKLKHVTMLLLAGVFFVIFFDGCSTNQAKQSDSPDIKQIKKFLVNPIDSSGNFKNYWVMMDTKIDSSSQQWKFNFGLPDKGKRTYVAFANGNVIAVNETSDTTYAHVSLDGSPTLGFDSYTVQPDSNILLSAYTMPDRLKIISIDENELYVAPEGFPAPIKYKKVKMNK